MEVSARRPNRREVAAAETRREILRAARRLFAERGFASTSVQQIAEESGVAVQTIYSSIGSKAALVLALNDLIDEEAGVAGLAAGLEMGVNKEAATPVVLNDLLSACSELERMLLAGKFAST